MKESIEKSLEKYPEFITSDDLVSLGVFKSRNAAYCARQRGGGPPFIKMKYKILYSKRHLADWLAGRLSQKN